MSTNTTTTKSFGVLLTVSVFAALTSGLAGLLLCTGVYKSGGDTQYHIFLMLLSVAAIFFSWFCYMFATIGNERVLFRLFMLPWMWFVLLYVAQKHTRYGFFSFAGLATLAIDMIVMPIFYGALAYMMSPKAK